VAPQLVAPLAKYEVLGAFEVGAEAGVGEWSLDHAFAVKPGTWRAWLLEGNDLDDLVEAGEIPEGTAAQLLLVHVDAQMLPSNELPPLTQVADVPIEAASFTVACISMTATLADMDGFYDHLDGVHGILKNGRGVHVQLGGDGSGVVWISAAADHILVELK
jgi:hypothetical protein